MTCFILRNKFALDDAVANFATGQRESLLCMLYYKLRRDNKVYIITLFYIVNSIILQDGRRYHPRAPLLNNNDDL